ncbi:hypothetical protein [Streptomyces lydicus]|uniref:hypothetical protein n=1 Tax=Streptomyces lydicus TaxID=47763 RepID=UPI003429CCA6
MVQQRTPSEHTPPEPSGADDRQGHERDDDLPEHEPADDGDSLALTHLRARVHRDYARRQQYGPLGRSL